MQGTMIVVHATDPTYLLRDLDKPPTVDAIQKLVGGPFAVLTGFDTMYFKNALHRCVAFRKEEYGDFYNANAVALWQAAVERKEEFERVTLVLYGDVVVILGDEELLQALVKTSRKTSK